MVRLGQHHAATTVPPRRSARLTPTPAGTVYYNPRSVTFTKASPGLVQARVVCRRVFKSVTWTLSAWVKATSLDTERLRQIVSVGQ